MLLQIIEIFINILEYDLIPDFVTTAVLFSTVANVVTLTILMAVV